MSDIWRPNGRRPRSISLTRVSRDPKFESTSHDTQHKGNLRCMRELEADLFAHYEETVSGALYSAREETQRALEDLEADRADYLILYDMSRYGRSVRWQQEILHRIERAGKRVQFATFRLEYDSRTGKLTAYSRHAFNNFGNNSELEREIIRERLTRGLHRKVEVGIMVSRSVAPYGYCIVQHDDVTRGTYAKEQTGKYIIVEHQAHWVRQMFIWYDEGLSIRAVASKLTELAVPTARGGAVWSAETIYRMLQNEAYKGTPTYSKTQLMVDEEREVKGLRREYSIPRPRDEWFFLESPPIVSEELWERVSDKMKTAREQNSGRTDRKHLLTGLGFCAKCGRRLYSRTTAGRTKERARLTMYRCNGSIKRQNRSVRECDSPAFGAVALHSMVFDAVSILLKKPSLFTAAQIEYSKSQLRDKTRLREDDEKIRLQKELYDLKKRERAAAESALDARIAGSDGTIFETMRRECEDKRVRVESRLQELETRTNDAPPQRAILPPDAAQLIQRVSSNDTLTDAQRGAILAQFIERVYPVELPLHLRGSARQRRIAAGKQRGRVLDVDEKQVTSARRVLGGVKILLRTGNGSGKPGPAYELSHIVVDKKLCKDKNYRDADKLIFETKLQIETVSSLPFHAARRADFT